MHDVGGDWGLLLLSIDAVETDIKKVIKNEKNIEYLKDICSRIKSIYKIWYCLILEMKLVWRKTSAEIAQFKVDTVVLLKAICEFIQNGPVPGIKKSLHVLLKSHLLFGFRVQNFLELYNNVGCFDKNSIESTHL